MQVCGTLYSDGAPGIEGLERSVEGSGEQRCSIGAGRGW